MIRALRSLGLLAVALAACSGGAEDPFPGRAARTSEPPVSARPSGVPSAPVTAPPAAAASASGAADRPAARLAADAPAAAQVSALAKDPPRPPEGARLAGPVDAALDGEWIARLASAEIASVTPNSGGSSVSMRVKFADGKKAALKPEQTGKPTDPRAEIAAYHVDRLLGFGRTAAVVGRRFSFAELRAALVASGAEAAFLERVDRSLVVKDGHVDAAMIAWHTSPLVEEEVAPAWAAALTTKDAPGDAADKLAEWSDLTVFDYLIDNPDRTSGGNILRLGKAGPLVFLDQGAAFGKGRLAAKLTLADRLDKVCRFRAATLAALRAAPSAGPKSLGARLRASLARDPIAPVLDDAQIAGLDERAAALKARFRSCEEALGAAATLTPH